MNKLIQPGLIAFVAEGGEGIGSVRAVDAKTVTIYIENAGEFAVPVSSVKSVHDQKLILDGAWLEDDVLDAIAHAHDREDPALTG